MPLIELGLSGCAQRLQPLLRLRKVPLQSLPQRHLPPFQWEHFCCLQPFFFCCGCGPRLGEGLSFCGPRGWAMAAKRGRNGGSRTG